MGKTMMVLWPMANGQWLMAYHLIFVDSFGSGTVISVLFPLSFGHLLSMVHLFIFGSPVFLLCAASLETDVLQQESNRYAQMALESILIFILPM